jgi:hypothetical protein
MTNQKPQHIVHPEMGEIPAIRVIDCIFGLMKNGRIAHFHVEQMEVREQEKKLYFQFTDNNADEHRTRCQVLPPFVNAFKK